MKARIFLPASRVFWLINKIKFYQNLKQLIEIKLDAGLLSLSEVEISYEALKNLINKTVAKDSQRDLKGYLLVSRKVDLSHFFNFKLSEIAELLKVRKFIFNHKLLNPNEARLDLLLNSEAQTDQSLANGFFAVEEIYSISSNQTVKSFTLKSDQDFWFFSDKNQNGVKLDLLNFKQAELQKKDAALQKQNKLKEVQLAQDFLKIFKEWNFSLSDLDRPFKFYSDLELFRVLLLDLKIKGLQDAEINVLNFLSEFSQSQQRQFLDSIKGLPFKLEFCGNKTLSARQRLLQSDLQKKFSGSDNLFTDYLKQEALEVHPSSEILKSGLLDFICLPKKSQTNLPASINFLSAIEEIADRKKLLSKKAAYASAEYFKNLESLIVLLRLDSLPIKQAVEEFDQQIFQRLNLIRKINLRLTQMPEVKGKSIDQGQGRLLDKMSTSCLFAEIFWDWSDENFKFAAELFDYLSETSYIQRA